MLAACAPSVKMLDDNGNQVSEITYNYLSGLKATECSDMYIKNKKNRGWMIGYLEYQRDVNFLTARGISENEGEKVIQQKTLSFLEPYKTTSDKYYSGMKFMRSYQVKISQPYINSKTGGLLFDGLYKTQTSSVWSGWNDVSIAPSYESSHGRFLDDGAPKYEGRATGNGAPMYKHVQKYVWSLPSILLKDTVLVESAGKIYLKLPQKQLREKLSSLISSNRPLTFTVNKMFKFEKCSNNSPYMKVIKFQLIDDSTGTMLIDWQE